MADAERVEQLIVDAAELLEVGVVGVGAARAAARRHAQTVEAVRERWRRVFVAIVRRDASRRRGRRRRSDAAD